MTAKEIADLFAELEIHLVASLKRNLMRHKRQEQEEGGKNGVPEKWEAWQSAKLRDVRRFRRENQKILGEYSPTISAETEKLLQEQFAEGGSVGFFRAPDDRLKSLIDEMQRNEIRIEKAALRYMNDVYRKTILRTATAMTAGGMTLQQATDEAAKDFLAKGVNCVQYSDGRLVNIASYAEMALRTCSTRAMLMGEGKQRERLGINTVLVSQYGACSDTCLPWQGKVYIDDVFQAHHGPKGGSFGVSLRTGKQYLLLSVAIKAGLFHPNCRHTISTWFEGVSTMPKPMDAKEIQRISKLETQQRELERKVRQAKREVAGLSDPAAIQNANKRLQEREGVLRKFVADNGDVLRHDPWRERNGLTVSPRPTPKEAKSRDSKISQNIVDASVKSAPATDSSAPVSPPKEPPVSAQTPKWFDDITGNWYPDAKPGSHTVQDLQSVTVDGITYQVDGRNVVLDYKPHEKEIAELLEREVGGELYMVPRVNNPQGVSTPDYLFHGKGYDLKTIKGAGKKILYDRISKKKAQASNFIFDLSGCALTDEAIQQQIEYIYRSNHTRFVDEIVIIKNGKVVFVSKRAKEKS